MGKAIYKVMGVTYSSQAEIAEKTGVGINTVRKRLLSSRYSDWVTLRPYRVLPGKCIADYRKLRKTYIIEDDGGPHTCKGLFRTGKSLYKAFVDSFVKTGKVSDRKVINEESFIRRLRVIYSKANSTITMTLPKLKSLITKWRDDIIVDGKHFLHIPDVLKYITGDEPHLYHGYGWVVDKVNNEEWKANYSVDYWRERLKRKR